MSVLPRSRTGSSQVEAYQRKRTDVLGTATVPLGYKLRQQTTGVKYPQSTVQRQSGIADILAPIPPDPSRFHANEAPNFLLLGESSTAAKIDIKTKSLSNVSDINTRRERLRSVISSEEASLAKEILNLPQASCTKTRAEEAARKDEHLRLREEEDQRHLVAAKRKQQIFESSHDVRDRLSREFARKVKLDNLSQIRDKNSRVKEEKELDDLWYNIVAREGEAQRRIEEEERAKKRDKQKETGIVLSRQMAEKTISEEELKRRRKEEREELEQMWEKVREEELRTLEGERVKREKFKKGLEEQLAKVREDLKEKVKQELVMVQKLKLSSEVQAREEKRRIQEAKVRLQREIEGFIKGLEELKAEQKKREEEVDEIIEKSARDIEARRDLARKRYRERQERLREEIVRARDDQLKVKRELEDRERMKVEEERELCRKDWMMAKAESLEEGLRKRENARRYREELQAQLDQREVEKLKEVRAEDQLKQKVQKECEEKEKFEKEIEQQDYVSVRAFRTKVKEDRDERKFF